MSVLVEALALVVPKRVLDVSYEGGTGAFLEALLALERPPRFVCNGDPHLATASFCDAEEVLQASMLLEAQGIVIVDDNRFVEGACVDQRFGPSLPCDWLEWRRHEAGFTYAWLAGTEPGDMATPVGWTAERSRQLVRIDVRDEPGRCMRLSEEDGIETWIDFKTGRLVVGLAQRDEEGASTAAPVTTNTEEVQAMDETP